jgi:hypothetical protein
MKKAKQIALVKINNDFLTDLERQILITYIKKHLEDYSVLVMFDARFVDLIKVELIK